MSEPPAFETFRFAWKWQQALIGIAVGGALLAITAERAPLSAIAGSLRAMDAGWAGLALIAYAADLALRVIRWRLLFAKVAPLPVVTFARALLVGYGLNILLPARLGELARIEYLKLRTQTRRSTAIPAILVERAMDGFLVLGALLLGLLAARSAGAISPILVGLIGTSAGLVAILVVAPLALRRVPAFIAGRLPLRAAESLARAHGALAAMEPGILGGAGLMTLAIYIAEAAALAAMLKAVGAAPDPGLLLALLGAASLSTLLPTAPGFLGSYQLAFALVFELFGHPPALGAAAATAVQAVLFAPLVLVALILALAPQRRRRAAPISTTERAG
ncbi:MAG TPA: lysylphosphatidylglycerol synthase transmembrane domain-containing protein [Alphaproteobacteria bacterium]|nr:lysylphosphatidylglycerol synthase transmembrane domain-containing protein [Alphaproteobacteria bacterium]